MSTGVSKYGSYLLFVLTMNGTSKWGTKLKEQGKHIYGISRRDLRDIFSQMLEYDDDIEDNFDLTEQIEEEAAILAEAYLNAYRLATGKITIKELLTKADDMIFLPYDPSAPETFSMIIDDLIEYYEHNEEYEKCSELVKAKKKFDDAG